MSAFACIKCGVPVEAMNPVAQKLMEQGGKMPMCDVCRRGFTRTYHCNVSRKGIKVEWFDYPCRDCRRPIRASSEMGHEILTYTGEQPACKECKAGITKHKYYDSYDAYLASPEWKALAAQRRKLDGNKCRLCYGTERLEVHHRTYDRQYHEDIEDLTTLCHECHSWYSAWVKSRENGRKLVVFEPVSFSMD